MDVLAVSPGSDYAGESASAIRLLENGLARYHLRKPDWTAGQTAGFIRQLPGDLQSRVSIHQHHELADAFPVGLHYKDGADPISAKPPEEAVVSRSLHRLADLGDACAGMKYVFLSPVFPSISKPGHAPDWAPGDLSAAISAERSARIYALGGIHPGNSAEALRLGFDGVVLHGALWQSSDPVEVLSLFRRAAA